MRKEYLEQLRKRNEGVSIQLVNMFGAYLAPSVSPRDLKYPEGFSYSGNDQMGMLTCPDGSEIKMIRMSTTTKTAR